jgi:DNA gyrase subunit A
VLLRLLPGETVVGAAGVDGEGSVLLATARGQIKRLAVAALRRCQRGDLGQIGLRFADRNDQLVDLRPGHLQLLAALLKDGRSLRMAATTLEAEEASGSGLSLQMNPSDQLSELIPLGL